MFQQDLLNPNIYEVNLTQDLVINEPLVIARRNNRRQVLINLRGHRITQTDPTKNVFEFLASSLNDMEINTQTWWKITGGQITGGNIGVFVQGGYLGLIEEVSFLNQITSIRSNLGLMTRIKGCFFSPKENAIILSSGGPQGTASNSQCNSSKIEDCHFQMKPGSKVGITIHSTNGVLIDNVVFEGGGTPDYLIKFQGSSTHARTIGIHNVHIEFAQGPTQAAFYSEISGNMIVDKVMVQGCPGIPLFELKHNGVKLVASNICEVPSTSYAKITPSCEVNIKDSASRLYNPAFWVRPDGTTGPPSFSRFEAEYRRGNHDTETGAPPPDDEVIEPDFFTSGIEDYVNQGEPFLVVWAGIVEEWATQSALFSISRRTNVPEGGYPSIAVALRLNSARTMASANLKITSRGIVTNSQNFATGLALGVGYTVFVYFDGQKYTCGVEGGSTSVFDGLPVIQDPTEVIAVDCDLWPNRPNGGNKIKSNSVVRVWHNKTFTPNQISAIIQ
jgi:hypothetical protein